MSEQALRQLADRQGGIFTWQQALMVGFTPDQIRYRARSGGWYRVAKGVYAFRGPTDAEVTTDGSHEYATRVRAVLLTQRRFSVASHGTAAVLHGLDLLVRDQVHTGITVTRPHPVSGSYRAGDIRVMSAPLGPGDVCEVAGTLVTTPARTVIDLARELSFRAGLITADCALRLGVATLGDLQAALLNEQGWPGIHAAMRVTEFADGLAETAFESLVRSIFIVKGCHCPGFRCSSAAQAPSGSSTSSGKRKASWARRMGY